MTSSTPIVVWFRNDLRLADNPALRWACDQQRPLILLYCYAPTEEGDWAPGGASRWWLHHALIDLQTACSVKGSDLLLRQGPTLETLTQLIADSGADTVVWNRRYEPAIIARDTHIKQALTKAGVTARSFNGALLFEPDDVATKQGKPYQVYTPFMRSCVALPERPLAYAEPIKIPSPTVPLTSDALESWDLLPSKPWDLSFPQHWNPTRQGGLDALNTFCDDALARYDDGRNLPSECGTSRLSPYLHHGQLGPREVWHAIQDGSLDLTSAGALRSSETFTKELLWREFAHHLLFHFPHTVTQPLRPAFEDFPWRDAPDDLARWQQGLTGYPLVDAGMRELWQTGWMHNRVRMITASFLIKHLRIHWIEGARWFWDTLVDADLAANTLGWQWTAGSGADASPYFRIFNPISQGTKFDAQAYVRRYVPEVAALSDRHLFSPWESPTPPKNYPSPQVDHPTARQAALDAYATIRGV